MKLELLWIALLLIPIFCSLSVLRVIKNKSKWKHWLKYGLFT